MNRNVCPACGRWLAGQENGCNYCPYKPICRYKGKQENPDPIFYMIEGDSNEVE